MNINQAKDKVQKEVLRAWWNNQCIGTAECTTGFGKSRLGVIASSYFAKESNYKCNILIIVPTTTLQNEWALEFKKWKETKVFTECVTVECINTARKRKNETFDLIIADEVHNYIQGSVNSKVFKNNTFKRILGLSATIEDNLIPELDKIAPICYTLDLYQAAALGLVSDFTIYNIPIELTKAERLEYDKLTQKITYAWEKHHNHSWSNISLRKNILYHAEGKMKLLKKIIKLFPKDSHGIVFSMTKDYANTVKKALGDTCLTHHSGISKKTRIEYLKKFADGRTKIKLLSSAKTLDEGVNLPRLEYGILMASSSKAKQQRQRIGRCIRVGENGKHAIIIRIYCKDTKEEEWVKSSQSKLDVVEVATLDKLKKLINS